MSTGMMPGEGWKIAGTSAGIAMKSGTALLVDAEKTTRLRRHGNHDPQAEGAALASVARGWIEAAEAIVRLAEQGVYVELEGS